MTLVSRFARRINYSLFIIHSKKMFALCRAEMTATQLPLKNQPSQKIIIYFT